VIKLEKLYIHTIGVSIMENTTGVVICGHCGNSGLMERVGTYSEIKNYEGFGFVREAEDIYDLLRCHTCNKITLRKYFWADDFEPDDAKPIILYPPNDEIPLGLPSLIQEAYYKALKVKNIDVDAYAILLRKALEAVCTERNARGGTLHQKIEDLKNSKEIPDKLVVVAKSLKDLGNVGAHSGSGNLTPAETQILSDLFKAILAYLYTAPYLAKQAEDALKKFNRTK